MKKRLSTYCSPSYYLVSKLSIILVSFIIVFAACSPKNQSVKSNAKAISHELWDTLLQKHVSTDGKVNYKGFLQDSTSLNQYLAVLEQHHPNDKNWTKMQQQAYWMNAYNAFTVALILKNYPLKSIKDITRGPSIPFINSPWNLNFIEIEGHKYDLNDLEHNILRPQFNDPRIHFGINCASISCPNLHDKAFEASNLDKTLDSLSRAFLSDTSKNILTNKAVQLSSIFKWFSGDFTKEGTIIDFLNRYTAIKISNDATIDYLPYNWQLNE